MFQQMDVAGVDHAEFFLENKYQINVDNTGTVKFCYIEHFPSARIKDFRSEEQQDPMIKCRFNSSIMTANQGSTTGTHSSFSTIINFPRDALIRLGLTVDKQKVHIERELKKIRVE
jgi:hypothetical protein